MQRGLDKSIGDSKADDKIAIRFVAEWEPVTVSLTYGSGSEMIGCVCGDVFFARGTLDEIRAEREPWQAAHESCVKKTREGRKVFWLSFCDADRPKGTQFLGACLIDVTAAEADNAEIEVLLKFPFAEPDSEWLAAAVKKAHRLGCNPGGEVASLEIPLDHPNLSVYRFGVLMDRATIEAIDAKFVQ